MAGEFQLRIKEIKKVLDPNQMVKGAYKIFVANTPIRSGNARRNTYASYDTINANYPYAVRLDNGWSGQSPNGMTKPTIKYLKDYLKKNLGK